MKLSEADLSRLIEMAWEDRTPFEVIFATYDISEQQLIKLMRQNMKTKSFKIWRMRINGRKTKYLRLRLPEVSRAYCSTQYKPKERA